MCATRQVVNCLMSGNNACFGLTFKPYIDDLRESPAMQVTRMIAEWHQGSTLVVEPNVQQLPASLQQSVALVGLEDALRHADVLVLLVDHPQFKAITHLVSTSYGLLIPKEYGYETHFDYRRCWIYRLCSSTSYY